MPALNLETIIFVAQATVVACLGLALVAVCSAAGLLAYAIMRRFNGKWGNRRSDDT